MYRCGKWLSEPTSCECIMNIPKAHKIKGNYTTLRTCNATEILVIFVTVCIIGFTLNAYKVIRSLHFRAMLYCIALLRYYPFNKSCMALFPKKAAHNLIIKIFNIAKRKVSSYCNFWNLVINEYM